MNHGPAQDALDDLDGTEVEVVGLLSGRLSPHVELVGHRSRRPHLPSVPHQGERLAGWLVLAHSRRHSEPQAGARLDGVGLTLLHDPDGHAVLFDQRP